MVERWEVEAEGGRLGGVIKGGESKGMRRAKLRNLGKEVMEKLMAQEIIECGHKLRLVEAIGERGKERKFEGTKMDA